MKKPASFLVAMVKIGGSPMKTMVSGKVTLASGGPCCEAHHLTADGTGDLDLRDLRREDNKQDDRKPFHRWQKSSLFEPEASSRITMMPSWNI